MNELTNAYNEAINKEYQEYMKEEQKKSEDEKEENINEET